jgi:hypothetical protein
MRALLIVLLFLALQVVAGAEAPAWRYRVHCGPQASDLEVDAQFPPGPAIGLEMNEGARRFVESPRVDGRPLEGWRLPASGGPRRLHYRFHLRAAVTGRDDDAGLYGDVIEAEPGVFLLHPDQASPSTRYSLQVDTPPGIAFASGVPPLGDGFAADVGDIGGGARTAFGPLQVERLALGGATLALAFSTRGLPLPPAAIRAWALRTAGAVAAYYGRFPVRWSMLLVAAQPESGKIEGHGAGGGGSSVCLVVGSKVSARELAQDWTFTHEIVHLALPNLHYTHHWLEEGLATYVEPLIRVRAGDLSAARVWSDLVEGLPQGEPEPGDRGLDRTPTWGRTYWGGALFCFMADLQIRVRTANRRSLGDALRGILAEGGDITVSWPIERVLEAGDRATATHVLTELYAAWATHPVHVDLAALWRKLGIRHAKGALTVDDGAPWAAIRRSMTR